MPHLVRDVLTSLNPPIMRLAAVSCCIRWPSPDFCQAHHLHPA